MTLLQIELCNLRFSVVVLPTDFVKDLLKEFMEKTGSNLGRELLEDWDSTVKCMVKVSVTYKGKLVVCSISCFS